MTRSEAIALSLPKYMTDKPCVNGHIAERYTQSGACSTCVRLSSTSTAPILTPDQIRERDERAKKRLEIAEQDAKIRRDRAERIEREAADRAKNKERRETKLESKAAAEAMIRMKTLCPDVSANTLRNFAFMLAALRNPALRYADAALPHTQPTAKGHFVSLYTLACFPEDRQTITDFAIELMKPVQATHAEVEAARVTRTAALIAQAAAEREDDNAPEGDPQ